MATKRITQETFDEAVKENIDEFDMSPEEALSDAIQQFESQGVNLVNIIKAVPVVDESGEPVKHPILATLDQLNKVLQGEITDEEVIQGDFDQFSSQCGVDISHRIAAGSKGAYPTLRYLVQKYRQNEDMLVHSLDALSALLNGQPDLMDNEGVEMLCGILQDGTRSESTSTSCIKTVRLSCIMHEMNRRAFVKAGLITLLLQTLEGKQSSLAIKEACGALRVLTVDDDVRVPFGKAHDHAKMIVEEGSLRILLNTLKDHADNTALAGDLIMTLGRLAVRNEFCQEIVDLGGLKLVLQVLNQNMDNQLIVKQVLAMLKVIAGNDQVKVAIMSIGGAGVITETISKHIKQPGVCEAGFAAIAAVTLRNPGHCKLVMEAGTAPVIIQAMQLHPTDAAVLRQACMAIRNLVARCREHQPTILALGAEPLIRSAGLHCKDEAKAALRDLECDVELKELWTGQRNPLVE